MIGSECNDQSRNQTDHRQQICIQSQHVKSYHILSGILEEEIPRDLPVITLFDVTIAITYGPMRVSEDSHR